MANSNATQLNINLQDSLNLNTNKAEISDFAGFNRRNAPFFNGGLSPLFKQEKTGSVIDKEGNVYKCENGNFYKNEEILKSGISSYSIKRDKLPFPDNDSKGFVYDKDGELFSITYQEIDSNMNVVVDYKGTTTNFQMPSYGFGSPSFSSPRTIEIKYSTEINAFIVVYYVSSMVFFTPMVYTYDEYKILVINADDFTKYTHTTLIQNSPDDSKIAPTWARVVESSRITVQVPGGGSSVQTPVVYIQFDMSGVEKGKIQPSTNADIYAVVLNPDKTLINTTIYHDENENFYLGSTMDSYGISEHFINANFYRSLFKKYQSETYIRFYMKPWFILENDEYTITIGIGNSTIDNITDITDSYVLSDGNIVYCNAVAKVSNHLTTLTASNTGNGYGFGCNAPEEGHYKTFSTNNRLNIFLKNRNYLNLLYNSNVISGISINDTLVSEWLSISDEMTPYPMEYKNGLGICYKDIDGSFYVVYASEVTSHELKIIENRYISFNTTDTENAYDINKKEFVSMFSDQNNRTYYSGLSFYSDTPIAVASCKNGNYENLLNPNISAIFNPRILYLAAVKDSFEVGAGNRINSSTGPNDSVDYYFSSDAVKNPEYVITYNYKTESFEKRRSLLDTIYPVSTDGNIILSPSLFATFYDSQIGADYIKDGRYYNLIYYEGFPLLAYYYGSGVANSEARFVIQGQSFVIRNGLIYSTTYYNGLMNVNNAIVNVDDLQFIGCLPLAAFFFSPATKCVLAFTGDRNLSTAFEATELKAVLNYKYAPNDNSLYLATEDAVYVLFNTPDGTSFVYKIEEQNVTDFVPQDNGCIALKTGNTWKIFSFYERPDFVRVPLKLTTKFFGAGLNRVSTVDCWYIRAFTEKAEKGKIKVKVQTLTNKSCTSEEQEFLINKEDWDANNGFIYLRYQPKLQRSVGVSLELESDFSIYDIQASIKADSTIQITSEKGF